jgi:hypothetical protein
MPIEIRRFVIMRQEQRPENFDTPEKRTSKKRNTAIYAADRSTATTSRRVTVHLILFQHFRASIARKEYHAVVGSTQILLVHIHEDNGF